MGRGLRSGRKEGSGRVADRRKRALLAGPATAPAGVGGTNPALPGGGGVRAHARLRGWCTHFRGVQGGQIEGPGAPRPCGGGEGSLRLTPEAAADAGQGISLRLLAGRTGFARLCLNPGTRAGDLAPFKGLAVSGDLLCQRPGRCLWLLSQWPHRQVPLRGQPTCSFSPSGQPLSGASSPPRR